MLNKKHLIPILVLLTLVLGGLSSSNTGSDPWYISLNKSSLNPPGYVFGIVWPILYIFMGIAAYRNSKDIFNIFIFQLFFNMIWSWLFFYFQMTVVALIDIAVLIILNLIILFTLKNIDKLSFMLYVPYVAWLFFAGYLNTYIVLYN